MKALLVDDDAFLREMYATKFTEKGHTVEVTESAEQGLTKLQDGQFDVVLLDMVMPGMTGVEFLQKVQELHLNPAPKCIVLSNQGEESDMKKARDAGATGYIVKAQMIPSEVLEKVEEYANT